MKKSLTIALSALFITSSALANSNFIQKQYPKKSGSCRIMAETEDHGDICVDKVITKDFRKSGDNLYYIVLGSSEINTCHACAGYIDLYAVTPKGNMIKSKGIELGSWGVAPGEWKFNKQKNGKIALLTETCFIGQGNVECSQEIFSVAGNKFTQKSK